MDLQKLIKQTEEKNPGQPLYNQAVREVLETICDFVNEHLNTINTRSWSVCSNPKESSSSK